MRWEQRPANTLFDGSILNDVSSTNVQWRNDPSTGEVPSDISANHDGLMLNVDMSLIFMPGLDVTNFTSGIAGCDQWESGCALTADEISKDLDCPELVSNPCSVKREPMGINQVPNINVWFESYHLFDTGFYRDFGIVWDKTIRVNNEKNLEYFVERIRPLYTYVGLQNVAPNNEYELPVVWWPDLNNLQLWTLNSLCELVKVNETVLSENGLSKNPLNGEFNPSSAYISVIVTRNSAAESEEYSLSLWFGDNVADNVQDQMIEYVELMAAYIDDTLWQLDTGWQNGEVHFGEIMEHGIEPSDFTKHFPNGLSYDNSEWTPQCDSYLVPALDSYMIEYNDSSHIVVDDSMDEEYEEDSTEEESASSELSVFCNLLFALVYIVA